MEVSTATRTSDNYYSSSDRDDRIIEQRLERLLSLNAEIGREKESSVREAVDVAGMSRPISSARVYSYFGLLIGTLPPFALALKIAGETMPSDQARLLSLTLLLAISGHAAGLAGYWSGRFIPAAMDRIATLRQPNRIAMVSLLGLAWGAFSGAIGGVFIFIVGSVFAAIAGGLVGAVALPVLVALKSTVSRGDFVELKHFQPIALGISLTLCAFVLGL